MNKDFDYTVKIEAVDVGSAVLIKQDEGYYLLTAAHICEKQTENCSTKIIGIGETAHEFHNLKRIVSPSKGGSDICVMKLPEDVAISLSKNVKCATFEGSGFPCEIDGYPLNARDKSMRIETACTIAKESEGGEKLYVKLEESRSDGQKLENVECGFSGSGVFVDSNGEKYLIGIIFQVEGVRNMFIGWKMQKINEILNSEGWKEIPLIPIELRQHIIDQYNSLIKYTNFVLSRIHNKIIGNVQLPRTSYNNKIENAIANAQVVIITGEAGIGKSALAKEVLTSTKYKSVAIVGDDLDEERENSILNHWNICDRIQDIFNSAIWGEGDKALLVESAERMLNGNTDTAVVFIENLLQDIPNLKIVFTIRKNSLDLFRVVLQANGIQVYDESVIEVGILDDDELYTVEDSIPSIKSFITTKETREILRNPFYLNLACSITSTLNVNNLKGSEFKDLLCRQIIAGKQHDAMMASRRIKTLKDIAKKTSALGMNPVRCEMTEEVLSLLKDDVLVGDIQTGLLRPSHDILTDWGLYSSIDEYYCNYKSKTISIEEFYNSLDKNVAFRNMFKQYIEAHIVERDLSLGNFISESLSLDNYDFYKDDMFYAILNSDNGSSFLASIKSILLENNGYLLKRISMALFYMFRKVDWNVKDFLIKRGAIEKGGRIRNSDYILPSGKGWYTFVTFLYENRDAFDALKEDLIPLLLQCELVSFTQDEAPNLKKYVFSILADDVERILSEVERYEKPNKEVIRLLFKWMDENPELIKSWVEKALVTDSYEFDVIKDFLLLSETLDAAGFIYRNSELYKSLIRKEWLDEEGIVRDYYPIIHQASGVTTTYKCFFYSHPVDAVVFLCELLNYDIEKAKNNQPNDLQEVSIKLQDKEIVLWGNDSLWRDYRGCNYHSHVRECLLMTFEKWLMDSINNTINESKYAFSKETILNFFDIVYNRCINVSAWGVLASVATRFHLFVGMKAMPIYSCRDFILWDKTRLSTETMHPMINSYASKTIRKEVADSYDLPHRKKDLEWVILTLSITEGFADEFRKLVKSLKDTATTYLEKVSASRMDIDQYKVVGKTDGGFVLQGSPTDDIKDEAEQTNKLNDQFNRIIKTTNVSRNRYDDSNSYDITEWREAYQIHKETNGFIESKGLIAALGVKQYWDKLVGKERKWCREILLEDTMKYVGTGQYQVDTEYSSDGLLYLLDKRRCKKKEIKAIVCLIGSIRENDALFTRFEKTFKELIWRKDEKLAKRIILNYLKTIENRRDEVDKFAHVCKLLPTDIEDDTIDKLVSVYCEQFFSKWGVGSSYGFSRFTDMRVEEFCAEYMLAMPLKRKTFIETWLASGKKTGLSRYSTGENLIPSVFNHYCYLATAKNKELFWQLWEIMLEWYKANNSKEVLSSLMINFNLMRLDLLDNWEVMEGSGDHINKLLAILPPEGTPFLTRLVCKYGFNSLMPECLRYINADILRKSVMESKELRLWQNAVEDLYDDAKTRDLIRRDEKLRVTYVEVLNALINRGSAIAYMIRDYYIVD